MTKQILAFSPGDILITFNFNRDIDVSADENTNYTVPVRRFVCESFPNGGAYGIFELGSELYEDGQYNVFENVLRENTSEMDIIVSPKNLYQKNLTIEPISIYEQCSIDRKQTVVPSNGDIVRTQYYFSNISIDWDTINLELPKEIDYAPSLDPLFRIARALEGIKKIMVTSDEKKESSEIVFTVEEFTDFVLNGTVPDKYKNKFME